MQDDPAYGEYSPSGAESNGKNTMESTSKSE
jgi:hypothetical protein